MSFYRNWHEASAWYRATKKDLCGTWWPKVTRHSSTMVQIDFTADEGNQQQISFFLDNEQAKHLCKQLTDKLKEIDQ